MNEHYIKLVGYVATFFTIISLAPQAYKLYLTDHTFGLSIYTFILIFLYSFFWLIYGLYSNDKPLIIAQLFLILFSTYIVYKITIRNIALTNDYNVFNKDIEYIKSLKWL